MQQKDAPALQGHLPVALRFFTIDKTYVFLTSPLERLRLLHSHGNGAPD